MLTLHTDPDPYIKSVCNADFTYGSKTVCKNPYVMLTLHTNPDSYVTLTLHTDQDPYVKIRM